MESVEEHITPQFSNAGANTVYFLLTFAAISCIYHLWQQSSRYTKFGNLIPGDSGLPFVGSALDFIFKSPIARIQELKNLITKYGLVVRVWLGTKLVVITADPRDVEVILGSSSNVEKSEEYNYYQPSMGDGLFLSKGERWRSHRKMIAPVFHQTILSSFLPVFNKSAEGVVQQLRENVLDQICDVNDYMGFATMDSLLETVIGVNKHTDPKTSFTYAKSISDITTIIQKRILTLCFRSDSIFEYTKFFKEQTDIVKTIQNLSTNQVRERKRKYIKRELNQPASLYAKAVKDLERSSEDAGKDSRHEQNTSEDSQSLTLLDYLIEASENSDPNFSDRDLRSEVETIIHQGHETTAVTASFFLCQLGINPEIQNQVYQELEDIFQGSNRPVTYDDTLQMKYLERVLLETLRLYPPVPMISRTIKEEVKLATGNYVLPKGTTVVVPQYLIHRNGTFFPNPNYFDPDNFLPERCQERPDYSFIPFSAGPRSCVGREYAMLKLKVLLAHMVRNFEVKPVVEEKRFLIQADTVLRREDGFRVVLEDRVYKSTTIRLNHNIN